MRVGSLVYATQQGLGILAKAFFDHGIVTDPLVVQHDRHENQRSWYPVCTPWVPIRELMREPHYGKIRDWAASLDVLLIFETPFDWSLIQFCKSRGVKTVLMPMHECTPSFIYEERYTPDLFLCPSHLDFEVFRHYGKCAHLPVPVEVAWRQRERALIFVHNAGHGGLRGRNGTKELVEALQYIKSPAEILIRTQEPFPAPNLQCPTGVGNCKVSINCGTEEYGRLWEYGDVFVFPEKFNGLSLPLQEARAAGMLVMATDRFPMNQWLPTGPLIPSRSSVKARIGGGYLEFDEAVIDPKDIAMRIDSLYGSDISEYSLQGKTWAGSMSWAALKPKYVELLEKL